MSKTIDKKMWREIIEKNLSEIKLVINKTYLNNSFSVEVVNEKDVKEFERQFSRNLPNAINQYLESKNENPKMYSRNLTYSINNKDNNIIISF